MTQILGLLIFLKLLYVIGGSLSQFAILVNSGEKISYILKNLVKLGIENINIKITISRTFSIFCS